MKRSSLQSSKNRGSIVEFSSGTAGVLFLLLDRYEDGPISLRLLRVVSSNFIAIATHMAAFNICHRSYHNIKRSFLPSSAILLCFTYKDKEPLPSD